MFDEKLCRKLPNGDPDFSDPAIFPTVWSEESNGFGGGRGPGPDRRRERTV
jgi:hypothetical protein